MAEFLSSFFSTDKKLWCYILYGSSLDSFVSSSEIFRIARSGASALRLHVHFLRVHIPRNGVRNILCP